MDDGEIAFDEGATAADAAAESDATLTETQGVQAEAAGAGAPTPEEQFLLQMLSDDDLADLRAAEQAKEEEAAEEEALSPEERQAKAEHDALVAAFDMVRSRSNMGKLTTPGTWAAEGLVPDHMIPVDFCDIAFDTIIAAQAESAERAKAAAEAQAAEEARKRAEAEAADKAAEGDAAAEPSGDIEAAEGAAQPEPATDAADGAADGEVHEDATDADELAADEPEWQLDDIKVLEGKQTYLYSSDYMTDTYAHWAFLSEEGDDALTLADNARSESRLYPRPMLATSLCNKPYYWSQEKIDQTWQAMQESGTYPDIKTCSASNGEEYFYSTDYLSDAQAKALAEWYSVERYMHV